MNWSKSAYRNYDDKYMTEFIALKTSLGVIRIEWRTWKVKPTYDVLIDDVKLFSAASLEKAKQKLVDYLTETANTIKQLLDGSI